MSGGARSVCLLAAIRSAASEAFLSGVRSLGTRPCVKRQPARVGGPVSRALTWGVALSTVRSSSYPTISGFSVQTASRFEPGSVLAVPNQNNLTFGRRTRQPHHDPAYGG